MVESPLECCRLDKPQPPSPYVYFIIFHLEAAWVKRATNTGKLRRQPLLPVRAPMWRSYVFEALRLPAQRNGMLTVGFRGMNCYKPHVFIHQQAYVTLYVLEKGGMPYGLGTRALG